VRNRPGLAGDSVTLPEEVREIVKDIREELDEHLDALNQNTAEIAATHEYVSELDMKLEKLAERVDALQALLLAQTPGKTVRLNPKEEDVYRILVEASEPVTSIIVGKQTGLTADLAAQTLYVMKQKGVPILAQTVGEQTFYALDARFKVQVSQRL
jgi:hypothetical protein